MEPREEQNFPFLPPDLWLICLGEDPNEITNLFKKNHLIEISDLFCRLDRKYTKPQLIEFGKQFGGEHLSGKKKDIILSIISLDAKKAEGLVADFELFECSENGRKSVNTFLKQIGSNDVIRRSRSRFNSSSVSNISKVLFSLAAGGIIGNKADKAFDLLKQVLHNYLKNNIDDDNNNNSLTSSVEQKIPSFRSSVSITYYNEDNEFIDFLEKNDGKLVYINSNFDFSIALKIQEVAVENHNIPIGELMNGRVNGITLPIPRNENHLKYSCPENIVFYKTPQTRFITGSGGLGVCTMQVRGFFEVQCSHYSGPSRLFYLTEVYVPFAQKWRALREIE